MTHHTLLPHGYTARPSRHEDAELLAQVVNAENEFLGYPDRVTAESLLKDYDDEQFTFPANTLTILNADATIVAGALLFSDKGVEEVGHMWYFVHPTERHKGLEDVVVAWYEGRMDEIAFPHVAADLKIALHAWGNVINPYRIEQLTRLGFKEVRRFYRMRIDLTSEPDVTPLPEGYRYVPYQHPEGIAEIVQVMETAFKDHWGHVTLPLEQDVEEALSWFKKTDSFDPSLFLCVQHEASGALVGVSYVFLELEAEKDKALVADIGVLREHRGKGIAEAMLTQTFHNFYQRGRNIVVLNVDTDNPSGALRLYRKVGMTPEREYLRLEKTLREGRDRAQEQLNA
jgi:GNAT superfamily N-acetyltransferase